MYNTLGYLENISKLYTYKAQKCTYILSSKNNEKRRTVAKSYVLSFLNVWKSGLKNLKPFTKLWSCDVTASMMQNRTKSS